ncbi:aminodeoxychorismate synthase component I [Sulfobacillus thermosulfidooxidans]|uniref:aminodeoxychorismate synthase component I n=1 Tax=Sulfobacillus thermosulfidooxidans TaxID=28034 RepID=UPI00040198DC|nr:aminodeoxychorismate synthase component I [Sulfobacillus thermosulfidooxidans]
MRVRLDFPSETDKPLMFTHPLHVIFVYQYQDVMPALEELVSWTHKGYWIAGFLSYEAAYGLIDDGTYASYFSSVAPEVALPLLGFGIFKGPTGLWDVEDNHANYQVGEWVIDHPGDISSYRQKIGQVKEAIKQGLTYQINYTVRLHTSFVGHPWPYYLALKDAQKAPYSGYIEWDDHAILSASPELFFALKDDDVITRPMKGTAPRGRYYEEDQQMKMALEQSRKNRAENIMITDLLRNDLGRIAELGSVQVRSLCQAEAYPTVWQLTSEIRAKMSSPVSWLKVLKALFPSGSITGAPKLSSMQIIQQLETAPREIYCGSLGYVSPAGEATFNVAIRTVWIDRHKNRAMFGTGGGITWDSRPDDEYEELLTKARFLTVRQPQFSLLETIRLDYGQFWLLSYHVERLKAAAAFYHMVFDPKELEQVLERIRTTYQKGLWRVRLMMNGKGHIIDEVLPWTRVPAGVLKVAWATEPILSSNPLFFHKTTQRDFYNHVHPIDSPFFDHVLWNEAGEVTEFTRGNIVVRYQGQLLTPAQDSGLLAGTYRALLLDHHIIQEAHILKEQLAHCDQIWFINSLHGFVPVQLTHQGA